MNNKNWHIDLSKCKTQQYKKLIDVYGRVIEIVGFLGKDAQGHVVWFDVGEEITTEEAFKRLGLDDQSERIAELEQQNFELNNQGEIVAHDLHEAEQRIKELEQQLAEQSHGNIDWSNVAQDLVYLGQQKSDHGVFEFLTKESWDVYEDRYKLIATRPKPKYTPEQIRAQQDLIDAIENKMFSHNEQLGALSAVSHAKTWLKEVNK